MKKLINIMLAALIALALPCTANGVNAEQQQRKTTAAKKTTTQRKKTTTARKPTTAAKKKTTQRKKTATKKKRSTKQNNAKYSTAEIRGLQSKRSGIQKEIRKQEEALRANRADVKKRLNDLLILNSEIDRHKQNIDGIQRDITHLDGNIGLLNAQLATLQQQLKERKAKYVKSMRYAGPPDVHLLGEEPHRDVPPSALRARILVVAEGAGRDGEVEAAAGERKA